MPDDQVWFRRGFLWGSFPIHWKGVVVCLVGVGVGLGGMMFALALGHPGLGAMCLLLAGAWTLAMAETHMERIRPGGQRRRAFWD